MKIKKALRGAFTPPEPQNKGKFLKSLRYPKMTYFEFILSQICYIRKRVWIFSTILMLIALGSVRLIPQNEMYAIWIIAAFIPFLALLTTTEISRSNIFGMSEIESACRFSLPQLAGARMIILGVCNFAVIAVIVISFGVFLPQNILKTALYIFTPYITVNGISLVILNKFGGADGVYFSAAATIGVSLAGAFSFGKLAFDARFVNAVCAALCVIGVVVTAVQIQKIIIGKDEPYGIKN
ncbi:MAG: hypothetical protein NC299_02880 [Lachnospiraceae bacterium]|nr:hypothetical protein [Ruminococcus sp.]MCM1274295.1 hypothetical protein [Lachnospiraceae bacterium]